MSEKPELLPCPFCGATMEDWHGQSFTHPLVETREEACILAGLSFSYQHSRWNTEEVLRWNRPAALSDHPTVKALVDAAVAAERERLLRPDLGFVCECGMSGPCMADNCKSPILDMTAAIRGETT
jgi:hypothetical protein